MKQRRCRKTAQHAVQRTSQMVASSARPPPSFERWRAPLSPKATMVATLRPALSSYLGNRPSQRGPWPALVRRRPSRDHDDTINAIGSNETAMQAAAATQTLARGLPKAAFAQLLREAHNSPQQFAPALPREEGGAEFQEARRDTGAMRKIKLTTSAPSRRLCCQSTSSMIQSAARLLHRVQQFSPGPAW